MRAHAEHDWPGDGRGTSPPAEAPMNRARRWIFSSCLLALAFGAVPETASADRMGIALRWNRCFGEEGAEFVRSFACDTNLGFESLVGSFALPGALPDVSGIEFYLDVMTYGGIPGDAGPALLPAWWQFRNVGSCRLTSLSLQSVANPADVVCTPFWNGEEGGGIGAYNLNQPIFGRSARIIGVIAVPLSALIQASAGVEYSAFTLTINHAKTVGTGACAGCLEPMQVIFQYVNVTQGNTPGGVVLTSPIDGDRSRYVLWGTGPVPTQRSSWSAVKSLYQ